MEFDSYGDRYKTVSLERDERGVLEFRLHTDGGPWQMSRETHEEVTDAFLQVGLDTGNEVVIITGTGDAFSGPHARPAATRYDTQVWEWRRGESEALIDNFLRLPVPVIAAINGPAPRQAPLVLLADIVLAADTATFEDSAHIPNNVVPGAAVGITMMALLGHNRGRYFLISGQELDAREALEAGLVSEVLAPERLNARAWELADLLMEKTPLVRRYTKALLNQEIRRRFHDLLGEGLALQGLAVIDSTAENEVADPASKGAAR